MHGNNFLKYTSSVTRDRTRLDRSMLARGTASMPWDGCAEPRSRGTDARTRAPACQWCGTTYLINLINYPDLNQIKEYI